MRKMEKALAKIKCNDKKKKKNIKEIFKIRTKNRTFSN